MSEVAGFFDSEESLKFLQDIIAQKLWHLGNEAEGGGYWYVGAEQEKESLEKARVAVGSMRSEALRLRR